MRIIAGLYRGKKLLSPEIQGVRPTADRTRESAFNILYSKLGAPLSHFKVLDVFSGTGAFGLEAVSRGAETVALLDINTKALSKNVALFPKEQNKIKVIRADATNLPVSNSHYNLAYIDAPYNKGLSEIALQQLAQKGWLEDRALCVVEVERRENLPIPQGFEQLDERIYGIAKLIFLKYQIS